MTTRLLAGVAAVAVLGTGGCAQPETGRPEAFCDAWGRDEPDVSALLEAAPEPIEDEVGRYVAHRTGGDPADEHAERIESWVAENCGAA